MADLDSFLAGRKSKKGKKSSKKFSGIGSSSKDDAKSSRKKEKTLSLSKALDDWADSDSDADAPKQVSLLGKSIGDLSKVKKNKKSSDTKEQNGEEGKSKASEEQTKTGWSATPVLDEPKVEKPVEVVPEVVPEESFAPSRYIYRPQGGAAGPGLSKPSVSGQTALKNLENQEVFPTLGESAAQAQPTKVEATPAAIKPKKLSPLSNKKDDERPAPAPVEEIPSSKLEKPSQSMGSSIVVPKDTEIRRNRFERLRELKKQKAIRRQKRMMILAASA